MCASDCADDEVEVQGAQSPQGTQSPHSIAGTPQFMAPEVIRQTGHGAKADIWSLGCTVIQMLTAAVPWNEISNRHAVFRHVGTGRVKPNYPPDVTQHCQSFLDECFQLDPDCRPSAQQLLNHSFISP